MSTKTTGKILLFFSFFLAGILPCYYSFPLSTNGRWIVDDQTGQRVKLHCVNWPTHNEPLLAEGLHARPLTETVAELANQGFNCVRLTWATYMFTRPEYGQALVGETFEAQNLIEAKANIEKHNPWALNLTHAQAYLAVVDELGKQGIMVDADNHVSKPSWCCSDDDGNGFFGDIYNDPKEWLRGVTTVAKLVKSKPNVIAIGMRNEPRGAKQNVDDWYKYFHEGAVKVHEINPNILVFISGLNKANDLTFLKQRPFGTNLGNKLVFESHWYGWDESWERPINKACQEKLKHYINTTTFFVNAQGEDQFPIFFGEFGLDQRGLNLASDHFLSCVMTFLTDQDLDWGLWAFQGSYYFREKKLNMEETFGVMDYHWNRVRNPQLMQRMNLIKRKNIDPISEKPTTQILFHPQSGGCVTADDKEVYFTDCKNFTRFNFTGDGSQIWLEGNEKCLKVVGDGESPVVSVDCDNKQSRWTKLSESGHHLAATDEHGEFMCLQRYSPYQSKVITTKCMVIEDDTKCQMYPQTDPTVQWFKLVDTNVED